MNKRTKTAMKKFLALTVALALSLSLAACSAKTTKTTTATTAAPAASSTVTTASATPLKITFVLPQVANEIWGVAQAGFEDACKAYNIDATVVAPVVPNDINEMNSLIETAIAAGTNGIVTQAVNPEGQAPAFAKLDEKGIPYCLVNSDAPNSKRLGFIGTGADLGTIAGEAIVAAMGGKKIELATALFSPSADIAIKIQNAYKAAFAKNTGGYEELVVIDTKSDQLNATSEYQNAFATYPNINVCINVCGFGAAAASKAMKEAGLEGKVLIMGIDDIQETLDDIKDGSIFATMTQNFYRMGYEPVKWISEFAKDGTKPANVVNDSGTLVVTKANIDTYKTDMRDPTKW